MATQLCRTPRLWLLLEMTPRTGGNHRHPLPPPPPIPASLPSSGTCLPPNLSPNLSPDPTLVLSSEADCQRVPGARSRLEAEHDFWLQQPLSL